MLFKLDANLTLSSKAMVCDNNTLSIFPALVKYLSSKQVLFEILQAPVPANKAPGVVPPGITLLSLEMSDEVIVIVLGPVPPIISGVFKIPLLCISANPFLLLQNPCV